MHLGATKNGIFLCLLRCYSRMEKIPLRQAQLSHTGGSPLLERVTFSDYIPAKRRTDAAGRQEPQKTVPLCQGTAGDNVRSPPSLTAKLGFLPLPLPHCSARAPQCSYARPSSSFLSPKKGPEPKVTAVAAE